jgi:transposase
VKEMPKTYILTVKDQEEIKKHRKTNRDKQVEKRLHAVELRATGKSNKKIAILLGTSSDMVSRWVSTYAKTGIAGLLPKPSPGRPPNLSFEEEAQLLSTFDKKAEAGQVVETSEIKAAYEAMVGHRIGGEQIYRVLRRHDWRKVKPRSRHPKKATPEVIEASKKLTLGSAN